MGRKERSTPAKGVLRTPPLPGLGDEVIEDIRDKALIYQEMKLRRVACSRDEMSARDDLLEAMKEHSLKRYYDSEAELLVEIVPIDEKLHVVVGEKARAEATGEPKKAAPKKLEVEDDEPSPETLEAMSGVMADLPSKPEPTS